MGAGQTIVDARRRLALIFIASLLPVAIYMARLWRLQVIEGDALRREANNNTLRTWDIAASRGGIYDREGRPFSQNAPRYILRLEREYWTRKPDDPVRLSALAAAQRLGYEKEVLSKAAVTLTNGPLIIDRDLGYPAAAYLLSHQNEFPGFSIDFDSRRIYPYGSLAAHVIGYLGSINPEELRDDPSLRPGAQIGRGGVERAFENRLAGRYGSRQLWVDSLGNEVKRTGFSTTVTQLPEAGQPLRLALDLKFQQQIEADFAGRFGAAVFLDPQTGEVLAMVSQPGYDLNDLTGRIRPEVWKGLQNAEGTPFINRATEAAYAPGSVWKVVMALNALTEGFIQPDTTFSCAGKTWIYGREWNCTGRHGTIDLRHAIEKSCNIYFYNVGLRMKIARFEEFGRILGLGQLTGVSLPGEAAGIMPGPMWKAEQYERLVVANKKFADRRYRWMRDWFPGESLSVAIGQGQTQVTPMQVARLMALIATDGNLVVPQLVTRVGDEVQPPRMAHVTLDPDALRVVKEAMCMVTDPGGTAARSALKDIKICGKTGTAQLVSNETVMAGGVKSGGHLAGFRENSWFAGYAPAENPRIAFAVLVEQGGHGSEAAAPIASHAVDYWFHQRKPASAGELQPKLQLADATADTLAVAPPVNPFVVMHDKIPALLANAGAGGAPGTVPGTPTKPAGTAAKPAAGAPIVPAAGAAAGANKPAQPAESPAKTPQKKPPKPEPPPPVDDLPPPNGDEPPAAPAEIPEPQTSPSPAEKPAKTPGGVP